MIERIFVAIENSETIMIDVEIDEGLCFHMEFIPEGIDVADNVVFVYGINGDLFEFLTDKIYINSDDFYYVKGTHFGKAIVTFA